MRVHGKILFMVTLLSVPFLQYAPSVSGQPTRLSTGRLDRSKLTEQAGAPNDVRQDTINRVQPRSVDKDQSSQQGDDSNAISDEATSLMDNNSEPVETQNDEIELLSQQFEQNIIEAMNNVIAAMVDKMEHAGQYSPQAALQMTKDFEDILTGFRYQVNQLKNSTVNQYYNYLQQNSYAQAYSSQTELTSKDHLFISGIENVATDAVIQAQSLILDLTSDQNNQLSATLTQALYDSAAHAQTAYATQLAINQKGLDRTWWQDLKGSGKDVCSRFKVQYTKQVKAEIAKKTQEAISEVGEIAVDAAGKKLENVAKTVSKNVGDVVGHVFDKKISELSGTLSKSGLAILKGDNSDPGVVALKKVLRIQNSVTKPDPVPTVRPADGSMCPEEEIFNKNRSAKVQKALQKYFDISAPVRIAICCSGGGNRAMVGTLGLLIAAADHGFLQSTMYLAGLSGSTWLIAPWCYMYATGKLGNDYTTSLKAILANYQTTLSSSSMVPLPGDIFTPGPLDASVQEKFTRQISVRFAYDLVLSAVDVWGALVGNYALNILGNNRLDVKWSDIANQAQQGNIPLPLCAAIFDPNHGTTTSTTGAGYGWIESGPFEFGGPELGGYIPISSAGTLFKDATMQVDLIKPEYPLSWWLGVYGSAFTVNIDDAVAQGLPDAKVTVYGHEINIPIEDWVKKMINAGLSGAAKRTRITKSYAQLPNFSQGITDSVLRNKENIALFDGGIGFNIPLPLLKGSVDRGVDVIIVYDSNNADVATLNTADEYYKRKNIAMPTMGAISKTTLLNNGMTVFNDPRDTNKYSSNMPTIMYFPTPDQINIKKAPFITLNFKYSPDDLNNLTTAVIDQFNAHVDDMKDVISKVAARRYNSAGVPAAKPARTPVGKIS